MRFRVKNSSMEPTIYSGEYVMARKIFGNPKKGDIIILKHPKKEIKLIKRITNIENGKYFVEGDNKIFSSDSRDFGPIERDFIIGKVIFLKNK